MLNRAAVLPILVSLMASGCAGTPPSTEKDPPPDFTLGITVFSRDTSRPDANPDTLARPFRPGRYILEPDGLLRVAIGAGATPHTFPPAMRRLTHEEFVQVWTMTTAAGYLNTPRDQAVNPDVAPAAVSRPTALVYVAAGDERRGTQVSLDAPDAETSRALIDRLAELAWVEK